MSTAIPVHVALVDETHSIDAHELASVAGALNEQVQSDFAPVWHVRATVGVYPKAPPATWAIKIRRQLDQPGALGYHTDDGHQPYALIELTSGWAQTVSHELLEMLADPWGNRLHGARLPQGVKPSAVGLKLETTHVHYLLEVCDPPEAVPYEVGGQMLSDFLLPQWYRTTPSPLGAYSRYGTCKKQREVADGGYVSFSRPDGEWFQAFNEGGSLSLSDLGKFSKNDSSSLRSWVDEHARSHRAEKG